MTRVLKIVLTVLIPLLALPCFSQSPDSKYEKELSAAKDSFNRTRYDDAIKHFRKAEKLRAEPCRECLIGMLRSHMHMGDLKSALKEADKALAISATGKQQAEAELYRGAIFSRMPTGAGTLANAETAFRAAVAANADCTECKFDLGLVLLRESKDQEGVEVLKAVLPAYKASLQEPQIKRFIADPGRARKKFAPEFSARTSSGQELTIDSLNGKVVLLDFWGTWCPPCRDSVPVLKELAAKNDPSKVMIISIDEGDPSETWAEFIQKNGMTWVQVYDEDHSIMEAFGVQGFPHYFLLSKDGIVLQTFTGWSHGELFTLKKAIDSALQ